MASSSFADANLSKTMASSSFADANLSSHSDGAKTFRTVRIRKRETDPDSLAPYPWGTARRPPSGVAGNMQKTTKYTILTFIPLNLMSQFRRLFNVFWLIQCIIVLAPGDLAPYSSITTITGFVFVLGVAATRDAYEDYQRYKADAEANAEEVLVYRDGNFMAVPSWQLLVGDIVKVLNDQSFPADLVVIASSDTHNTLFVETSNLDGERNLKRLRSLEPTCEFRSDESLDKELQALLLVEAPNDKLYKFNGQIRMKAGPQPAGAKLESLDSDRVYPINVENICLRGARLKNTEYILGVVVYAGMETKLQMNSKVSRNKFSALEKRLNRYIIYLFGIIFVVCILTTAGSLIVFKEIWDHHYLAETQKSYERQLLNFFTYLVLLNAFIPLSLVVSIELSVFAQGFFMMWDNEMRTPERGPMKVQAAALNAELGQIEYVFCDKTGTLTQNKMVFKHCSILGQKYLNPMDGELARVLASTAPTQPAYEGIQEFLRLLALCNDVVPDMNQSTGNIDYNSASPDETALVLAAVQNGFELISREPNTVVLRERGQETSYQQMAVFDFTSDRRRMSVVIRTGSGKFMILTKGADMVMVPLCKANTPATVMADTLSHMEEFAGQGYRVMLAGVRVISADEFNSFQKKFQEASTAMEDRDTKREEAYALLEKDLMCLGVTCVEDKLQDGVPETVQYLLKAGMHVWILTGDKLETAITIAYSSSIINQSMALSVVDGSDWDTLNPQIRTAMDLAPGAGGKALVIGGNALSITCDNGMDLFVELCKSCTVVVCARCAPVQKADVVTVVMRKLDKISLAIGDGGNDVPMILAANVGVGLMGNEGMQASRSADFSMGQFSLLKKLVAVHGRYSNLRMAELIKYSFYKNVTFCAPQVIFALYCFFSGNTVHNAWIILAFNIIFTGLQPLVIAIFERDISEELIYLYPEAYCTPDRKKPLTTRMMLELELSSLFQGILYGFGVLLGMTRIGSAYTDEGQPASLDATGFVLAQVTMWGVTVKLITVMRHITIIHHISIWISIAGFYLVLAFLNFFFCPDDDVISGCGIIFDIVLGEHHSWLLTIVLVTLGAIPDIAVAYYRRQYYPEEWQKLQEVEKIRGIDAISPHRLDGPA